MPQSVSEAIIFRDSLRGRGSRGSKDQAGSRTSLPLRGKAFEVVPGIDALGRLRRGIVESADDAEVCGMLVHAQKNPPAEHFCHLQ